MYGLHELFRKVVAVLKEADAKTNLKKYLETKIRPAFLEKVSIDSILKPLVGKAEASLGRGIDGELFKEDLVDMFIDDDGGDKLLGLLLSHARERGLAKEDSNKVVHGGALSPELQKKVTEWQNEFGKLAYEHLHQFMNRKGLEWIRQHAKEAPSELGVGKEEAVLDEKELEKQIKEEYEWEEGLVKDILSLINREVSEGHRALYKLILKDRFLSKTKKSLKDIGERVHLDETNVLRHEKKMAEMLKNFLKAQGLGPKFDVSEKNVEVPSMDEILKNEENRKDLKEFLKNEASGRGKSPSELTIKVLDMLVDGKSTSEIAALLDVPNNTVRQIKARYFNPGYEEWYKDMVEDIRQVCARLMQAAKTVRVPMKETPEEKKKKEDTAEKAEKGVTKIHETMVNNALDHHRVRVTVSFQADHDNMTPATEKTEDGNFKWVSYEATMDESRRGGEKEDGSRPQWSVEYHYTHKLDDDGQVTEKGTSSLIVDGKEVSKDHPLMKYIEDHMEKVILKEGAIPHGKFPVEYVNTKTGKHYHGTHDFLKMHEGIFVPDSAHENRLLEKQRWEEKKRLGPSLDVGDKAEIEALKSTLKRQLKTEDNEENKKKIKDHLKQLEDLLEMKGKFDLDEIEDIIKQEQIIRKPEVVHTADLVDYDSLTPPPAMVDYDCIGVQAAIPAALDYDQIGYEPRYAAMLPGPQSEGSKAMLELFKGYGLTSKPSPFQWLVQSDLIVLAKMYRAVVEAKLQKEMKAKKPKGVKKDEWEADLKRIEGEYKKDVEEAQKYFPAFIEDLKVRRDKFEKDSPRDFAEWSKGKNLAWVDNKEEIDKVLTRVKKELAATPNFEPEKKEQGPKMLEKTKWNSLEGFLHANQRGFISLGNRLAKAPLKPVAGKEFFDELRQDYAEIQKDHNALGAKITEISKGEDEGAKKELEQFRKELGDLTGDLKKIDQTAKSVETIPAIATAEALKEFTSYFTKLYSLYSGILWFRDKYAEDPTTDTPASPEEKKDKEKTIGGLEADMDRVRAQVVKAAKDVGETSLRAKDEIKGNIAKVRTGLNKFLDGMSDLKLLYVKEQQIHKAADPKPEETYEQRLKKFIFPEHVLAEAQKVVENVKKKRKDHAPQAEKELKDLTDSMVEAFKDKAGFEKRINEVAKKKNISREKAAILLKKYEEGLAKAAVEEFILGWTEVAEIGPKVEKSPLGNKHHTEYDRMGKFVEDHLPDLFKLAPPEKDEMEPPKPVKVTPKEVVEALERLWDREREPTPEELQKLYKIEGDKMFGGGGGGGKSKGRAKPAKAPVPSATHEQIKDDIGKLIKHKNPQQIVLTIMAVYTKRVRDAIKNLKEGEYIEVGDVIDGFVYLLKNTQNMITNLNTHPSVRTFEAPSKGIGAPSMTGTPDIPIDSYKETVALFDKIKGIYDEINHYIAPDTVGVPPESLKNLSKSTIRRYLPRGLPEWADWYAESEGKRPEPPKDKYERLKSEKPAPPESTTKGLPSHTGIPGHGGQGQPGSKTADEELVDGPCEMSFNVARKFAGIQLPVEEFEAIMT